MKTAIFHNYLDNIGGTERVVFTLASELKADVYTTNIDKNKNEINSSVYADNVL